MLLSVKMLDRYFGKYGWIFKAGPYEYVYGMRPGILQCGRKGLGYFCVSTPA